MTREADTFGSPIDPRRDYLVIPPEADLESTDLDDTDDITIINSQGSMAVSKERMEIDRGRLKPRLGRRSLTDVVTSANERWALDDDEPRGAIDA